MDLIEESKALQAKIEARIAELAAAEGVSHQLLDRSVQQRSTRTESRMARKPVRPVLDVDGIAPFFPSGSPWAVRHAWRTGALPSFKIGRRRVSTRAAVAKFLHVDPADLARDGDKSLHLADLLAAPQAVRHAVAQLLIGEGHCIAELPAAAPCPDDLSLLASHVRETSAAQLALVEAMADGSVSADEGARLVECSQRVHAVTATVAALGRRAVANRSVRLKAVAR